MHLNTVTSTPVPWTTQFVGQTLLSFNGQFPNWDPSYASTTAVLGDPQGYASLADARAAVEVLRPVTAPKNPKDWKSYAPGVAYLQSDEGHVAAFELSSALLESRGFFGRKLVPSTYCHPYNDRVVAVDNRCNGLPVRISYTQY